MYIREAGGVQRIQRRRQMATQMHRTQIYLPKKLTEALDGIARKRGTSRAEVIREAAQRLVQEEVPQERDPLLELIGLFKGGDPGDVSREHDRYLVEAEMKRW